LEDAGREGYTCLAGEHQRVGVRSGEALEVIIDGGEYVRRDGERAPPGRALRLLH